ncbi:MAG: acetolactate synthase small subunit [Clostridia bacterium]
MKRYILSVMVFNHFGVLTRISGLFARRGYNITSLTVGETQDEKISRMTIQGMGDDYTINQIKSQLSKVEDVISVTELFYETAIFRELYLVKVAADDTTRSSILQIAEIFKAKPVDVTDKTVVFEVSGDDDKLKAFYANMQKYGVTELARTGLTAIARGTIDTLNGQKT